MGPNVGIFGKHRQFVVALCRMGMGMGKLLQMLQAHSKTGVHRPLSFVGVVQAKGRDPACLIHFGNGGERITTIVSNHAPVLWLCMLLVTLVCPDWRA